MDQRKKDEGCRKYFKLNTNENTKDPDSWNAAKAMLTEQFIALNACIKKYKRSQRK